jgi:hypothetical protein
LIVRTAHAARRPLAVVLLAALFATVAVSDLWQVGMFLAGRNSEVPGLMLAHAVLGLVGAAAATAVWRRSSWSVWLAALWGVLTAALLASLPSVLGLAAEERGGVWVGAAAVLLVGAFAAWYLRRHTPA